MRLFPRYTTQSAEAPRTKRRGLSRTAERQAQAAGYRLVAGVDEAGRGRWLVPWLPPPLYCLRSNALPTS